MKKKVIKINESRFQRIVEAATKKVLKEYYFWTNTDEWESEHEDEDEDETPIYDEWESEHEDEDETPIYDEPPYSEYALRSEYGNLNTNDDNSFLTGGEHPALAAQHKHNNMKRKVARNVTGSATPGASRANVRTHIPSKDLFDSGL